MRPAYLNLDEDGTKTLAQVREQLSLSVTVTFIIHRNVVFQAAERKPQWTVFVEFADPKVGAKLPPHDPNDSCFCFFKFFDPDRSKMIYVGCRSIPHNSSTSAFDYQQILRLCSMSCSVQMR